MAGRQAYMYSREGRGHRIMEMCRFNLKLLPGKAAPCLGCELQSPAPNRKVGVAATTQGTGQV